MSTNFKKFYDLHHTKELFVLPNVWNAKSALLLQEKKFQAVATSSAAVANSIGYKDGEDMPFTDYLFVINRILASIQIPLTVDMEMGYGSTKEAIYSNVEKLANMGVVGMNIEDSIVSESGRVLKDAAAFAKTIEYVKTRLVAGKLDFFINVRCDTYILDVPNKQDETKQRLGIYNTSGADGIFLPCITNDDDIAAAVASTGLPVSVMCIPGLPAFDILNRLGVRRASMGPFLFNKIYDTAAQIAGGVINAQSFAPIFS
jgi:2-methylisocitrate lyase-like PEP mutase family enzyme